MSLGYSNKNGWSSTRYPENHGWSPYSYRLPFGRWYRPVHEVAKSVSLAPYNHAWYYEQMSQANAVSWRPHGQTTNIGVPRPETPYFYSLGMRCGYSESTEVQGCENSPNVGLKSVFETSKSNETIRVVQTKSQEASKLDKAKPLESKQLVGSNPQETRQLANLKSQPNSVQVIKTTPQKTIQVFKLKPHETMHFIQTKPCQTVQLIQPKSQVTMHLKLKRQKTRLVQPKSPQSVPSVKDQLQKAIQLVKLKPQETVQLVRLQPQGILQLVHSKPQGKNLKSCNTDYKHITEISGRNNYLSLGKNSEQSSLSDCIHGKDGGIHSEFAENSPACKEPLVEQTKKHKTSFCSKSYINEDYITVKDCKDFVKTEEFMDDSNNSTLQQNGDPKKWHSIDTNHCNSFRDTVDVQEKVKTEQVSDNYETNDDSLLLDADTLAKSLLDVVSMQHVDICNLRNVQLNLLGCKENVQMEGSSTIDMNKKNRLCKENVQMKESDYKENVNMEKKDCKGNVLVEERGCNENVNIEKKDCKESGPMEERGCKENMFMAERGCKESVNKEKKDCNKNVLMEERSCKENILMEERGCLDRLKIKDRLSFEVLKIKEGGHLKDVKIEENTLIKQECYMKDKVLIENVQMKGESTVESVHIEKVHNVMYNSNKKTEVNACEKSYRQNIEIIDLADSDVETPNDSLGVIKSQIYVENIERTDIGNSSKKCPIEPVEEMDTKVNIFTKVNKVNSAENSVHCPVTNTQLKLVKSESSKVFPIKEMILEKCDHKKHAVYSYSYMKEEEVDVKPCCTQVMNAEKDARSFPLRNTLECIESCSLKCFKSESSEKSVMKLSKKSKLTHKKRRRQKINRCSYVMEDKVVDRCPLGHFLQPKLATFNLSSGKIKVPCKVCKITVYMQSNVVSL